MADFAANDQLTAATTSPLNAHVDSTLYNDFDVTEHYYLMTGTDAVTTARDSWKVIGAPDTTGAQYTGALTQPLRNIFIANDYKAGQT